MDVSEGEEDTGPEEWGSDDDGSKETGQNWVRQGLMAQRKEEEEKEKQANPGGTSSSARPTRSSSTRSASSLQLLADPSQTTALIVERHFTAFESKLLYPVKNPRVDTLLVQDAGRQPRTLRGALQGALRREAHPSTHQVGHVVVRPAYRAAEDASEAAPRIRLAFGGDDEDDDDDYLDDDELSQSGQPAIWHEAAPEPLKFLNQYEERSHGKDKWRCKLQTTIPGSMRVRREEMPDLCSARRPTLPLTGTTPPRACIQTGRCPTPGHSISGVAEETTMKRSSWTAISTTRMMMMMKMSTPPPRHPPDYRLKAPGLPSTVFRESCTSMASASPPLSTLSCGCSTWPPSKARPSI